MRKTGPETAVVEVTPPNDLIPLAHLVLEGLAEGVDQLADSLDDVLLDDIGRRCTTRETARRLFTEAAEAEERRRVSWRAQQEQLTRRQGEALAGVLAGMPVPEGLEGLSAVEVMLSGAQHERLNAAGRRRDEYVSGELAFHPLLQEEA